MLTKLISQRCLNKEGFETKRLAVDGKKKQFVQGETENDNVNDNGTGFISEDDELDNN